jgi:magnesium chelatase subunit D
VTTTRDAWQNAKLALTILAVDPIGLGGLNLRARSGPVRDRFIAALAPALAPRKLTRAYPAITDDQLFGGIDLSATLQAGRTVLTSGLLTTPNTAILLSMSERCPAPLAARLAIGLDQRNLTMIALDEGIEDEATPDALLDRLAFHITLDEISLNDCPGIEFDHDTIAVAQRALPKVKQPKDAAELVTQIALRFGITSLRAPLFVLRAARARAALRRETEVTEADLSSAAALILGPRARLLPDAPQEEDAPAPTPEDAPSDTAQKDPNPAQIPEDLVLAAVAASLPKDILDRIATSKASRTSAPSGGSGDKKRGNRRGRPVPPQKGQLGSAARLDLIATLRAAAPWQTLRRQAQFAPSRKIHIRPDDIRLKRFEEKSDRLLIFAVDASGSSALARLAEAKGAVELLLAEAYARRDHVALIAFRGSEADVMLPPTRSLVQTKRRLAALAGGGGTPLASGLEAALLMAETTKSKGLTPTIAILTDGRANVALDGSANRITAAEDARTIARMIRAKQTPALVIDTGNRPQKALSDLASELQAPYLPLPRADAHQVSQAIEAALG